MRIIGLLIICNYVRKKTRDEEYKPEELLSVRPVMTGVASGIVIKEGAIAVRFSSVERFRLGVTFVLYYS